MTLNETWSINSEWHGNWNLCRRRRFQAWGFQNVFEENVDIKAKISRANS